MLTGLGTESSQGKDRTWLKDQASKENTCRDKKSEPGKPVRRGKAGLKQEFILWVKR